MKIINNLKLLFTEDIEDVSYWRSQAHAYSKIANEYKVERDKLVCEMSDLKHLNNKHARIITKIETENKRLTEIVKDYFEKCSSCKEWKIEAEMTNVGTDRVCQDCVTNGYGK